MVNYSIAEEGFPICAGTLLISTVFLAFDARIFGTVLFILFLAETFFFRDPDRIRKSVPGAILSPADGKILNIEDQAVSIFMSLFDVHINRVPANGVVDYVKYKKGKFIAAFKDNAEKENEQNTIALRSEMGEVLITQIAGILARRIVCRIQKGDNVESGQRFGMIKFGSRIRILLPSNAKINVKIGEKVKAGITIIAYISKDRA